jgi:hypothetical protein
MLVHEYKTQAKTAFFHVHAQIIDYQQCTFMEQLANVAPDNLVAYFTDGFFTREPIQIKTSTQPGGFKYTRARILGESTDQPMVHKNYTRGVNYTLPEYAVHSHRSSTRNITRGPAGCGKTYISVEKHPMPNQVNLAPNHRLKSQLAKFGPAMTYHKFFGIGVPRHEQQVYENVLIDECTEIPDHHLRTIVAVCKQYRMCLNLYGDLDIANDENGDKYVKIYQRPPPNVDGYSHPIEYHTIRDFNICPEISPVRRQSPEDAAYLDSLRELSYREIYNSLVTTCKTARRADDLDLTENFVGIASKHKYCHELNARALEQNMAAYNELAAEYDLPADRVLVPAKYVGKQNDNNTRGALVRAYNDVVWADRKDVKSVRPKEFKYELAYFCTADSVQGATFDDTIYIDLRASHTENFLYSAVTRCRRLDQVVLLI